MMRKPCYRALCPHCIKRVTAYGYPAIWMLAKVCESFADGYLTIYENPAFRKYNPIVRWLERRGYFISTEIELNMIAIVPNTTTGIYYDLFGYYCWCIYDVDLFELEL